MSAPVQNAHTNTAQACAGSGENKANTGREGQLAQFNQVQVTRGNLTEQGRSGHCQQVQAAFDGCGGTHRAQAQNGQLNVPLWGGASLQIDLQRGALQFVPAHGTPTSLFDVAGAQAGFQKHGYAGLTGFNGAIPADFQHGIAHLGGGVSCELFCGDAQGGMTAYQADTPFQHLFFRCGNEGTVITGSPQGNNPYQPGGHQPGQPHQPLNPYQPGHPFHNIFSAAGPRANADGSGNNPLFPHLGQKGSELDRLGPDRTPADGSLSGADRPNARTISNAVADQKPGESIPNKFGGSDFVWQWGQFIDHDISLTPPDSDKPANIDVPKGDPQFDPHGTGQQSIPFNRSETHGNGQQVNEITSWIDGSHIYGSDAQRQAALREGPNSPFLKTSAGDLLPRNTQGLENDNGPSRNPANNFVAGDVRANEQAGLTAMHTLFVREHNRVAAELQKQNPDASAEQIFQSAKKVVTAQVQKITYEEFLPSLIGKDALQPYSGYNPLASPEVKTEFSTAAFRLGHSMVNENVPLVDKQGNPVDDGALSLRESFFQAPNLLTERNDIDPILRGLASQRHQALDTKLVDGLRNNLFGPPGSGGLDLAALNIQRGRDHGLGTYNETRAAMGLEPAKSFSDITSDKTLAAALERTYGDVDKVDLWIGGLAEDPLYDKGSQTGELFRAIIANQFTALRDADRFWYERPGALTAQERAFVDNSNLASIIRANTGIGAELQDDVFHVKRGY